MLILFFNATLSMMNIRDFIFINKAKNVNKIRILDILGFESNTFITQSPENIKNISESIDRENEEILLEKQLISYEENPLIINNDDDINIIENAPTETFEPLNVTSKIKNIWIDIEKRRKWVVPTILMMSTSVLIATATSVFINNKNTSEEINILYDSITTNSNNLINDIPEIIDISTDVFYSKYDVSNASANLQIIESTLMEYDRNLINREDYADNNELNENLSNLFILIDDLDDLITYRILRSEILIYNDLFIIDENIDIDLLSSQLSEISAKSKRNFENLPVITEFKNHILLLEETLISAEDLHGRLIAALRNNEFELAKSLVLAITMNKDIESSNFEKSLLQFNNNKTNLYNSISKLP